MPSPLTAVATTTALTILPSSLTFWVCVQPQVRVGSTVQRTAQEAIHHHVQLLTDARHLALGDALTPQCLDQVIHPPCGYPFHVGLLYDRQQARLRRRGSTGSGSSSLLEASGCAAPSSLGTEVSHARDRYPLRWFTRSGLRSPYSTGADTSASMIPSTSTLRASRRKSTSPSIPPLRNSSSRSIFSLTTVVLLSRAFFFAR